MVRVWWTSGFKSIKFKLPIHSNQWKILISARNLFLISFYIVFQGIHAVQTSTWFVLAINLSSLSIAGGRCRIDHPNSKRLDFDIIWYLWFVLISLSRCSRTDDKFLRELKQGGQNSTSSKHKQIKCKTNKQIKKTQLR